MNYKNITLDPFQVDAIRIIDQNASVIVSAPTGAGKTIIAEYAIEKCLKEGKKIIYTAPIKALSNQKFRDFSSVYGDKIGVLTGDVSINPGALAVIMTTEIFRNTIFDSPERLADINYVIFDEIHFMDDDERGTVWEESIIFAPKHIQFICLSATVSNLHDFAAWIRKIRGCKLEVIQHQERPVPLRNLLYIEGKGVKGLRGLKNPDSNTVESRYPMRLRKDYDDAWKDELIVHLRDEQRMPCLYFIFNRKGCEERAIRNHLKHLLTPEESKQLLEMFEALAKRYQVDSDPETERLGKLIKYGVAFHHAGMMPVHKEIIERLFTTGLIKLLFATETFALGVNMPAKTVVFDSIHKFDGIRESYLRTREFHQMAGRAGRRGIDSIGYVYSNIEYPFPAFETAERIFYGAIEPIQSQYNLSYATLLNLYERLGDRIFAACEKSFGNFMLENALKHRRKKHGRNTPEHLNYYNMVDQVRKRLNLLKAKGYLENKGLTAKGHFAKQIYGYEIQVTEIIQTGLLDGLDEDWLNVLFCAIVFESKRACWYGDFNKTDVRRLAELCTPAINAVRKREREIGIRGLTKEIDYKLSLAIKAWSEGCGFADLSNYTNASDGDIIRTMRLTIQLLRQVAYVKTVQPELRAKLLRSVERIKRDVVDAERQMRLG
ncbi:MAG: DEAD/DEAH box helicase [Planctomycetes bacterium]|nr:DEAD/DEAH box helicase [Planctomycetota bacterium]